MAPRPPVTFSTSTTSRGSSVGTIDSDVTTDSVKHAVRHAAAARPPPARPSAKAAVSKL